MRENPSSRSPVVTNLSIAFTFLLLIGLVLAVVVSGGAIFNPGQVSAKSQPGVELAGYQSHAAFENSCGLCHQPLQTEQAALCLDCHRKVADQIDEKNGTHGRLEAANRCAACHAEHKGRDFDPTITALELFDHEQTRLPLSGKHAAVECQTCHTGNGYDQADPECSACHTEPPQHAGMFGLDCAACHSDRGWKPAAFEGAPFNHDQTRFGLARHAIGYDQKPLTCTACHSGTPTAVTPQACADCHGQHNVEFMQKHEEQFGPDCVACHDGVDRMHAFDHARVFPLDGMHTDLACERCHAEKKFRGTPGECVACHQEPELHAGFFGQKCQYCHTSQGWQPGLLQQHPFPLNHGAEQDADCTTCHLAEYQTFTCYTCHDHQPEAIQQSHSQAGIRAEELPNCAACHLDGKIHEMKAP